MTWAQTCSSAVLLGAIALYKSTWVTSTTFLGCLGFISVNNSRNATKLIFLKVQQGAAPIFSEDLFGYIPDISTMAHSFLSMYFNLLHCLNSDFLVHVNSAKSAIAH